MHHAKQGAHIKKELLHGQSAAWAAPGRDWWLRAARHSQGEAGPPCTQPLPRVLERAASKAAHFRRLLTPFSPPSDPPLQVPLVEASKYGGGLYVQGGADVASRRLVGLH